MGMAHSTAWTQYLLFQENVAGLQPAHLVLMGTVSEITITLCEVPTGMVADTVSRRLSFVIGLLILGLGFLIQGLFPVFGVVVACSVLWGLGETFISGAREAWIADEMPGLPMKSLIARRRNGTLEMFLPRATRHGCWGCLWASG